MSHNELLQEISALRDRIAELESHALLPAPHSSPTPEMSRASRISGTEARRLAEESTVLAEIGRIISSSLNIDEVYELFAAQVRKLIPFDTIAITLVQPEPGTFIVAYTSGVNVPERALGSAIELEGSGTGEAIRAGRGILMNLDDEDRVKDRFPSLLPVFKSGHRSYIAAPLISKGRAIGAINIVSVHPNAYTTRDATIAENVGAQIAGAIANAQLYLERTQAEEALRANTQRLHAMVEAIPSAVSITRISDGQILYANKHLGTLFGMDPKDLIGRAAVEFYSDAVDRETLMRILKSSGRIENREVQGHRYGGDEFWVLVSAEPIKFNGEDALITGYYDITERKNAENALKESEAKNRALVEAIPDQIFRIGRDGKILDFIPFENISAHVPGQEDSGISLNDVVPEETANLFVRYVGEALSTGLTQFFEYRMSRSAGEEGERDFEARIVVSGEDEVLAIVRDMTERNHLERQLIQAQKMEAVGQLAGGVAHDFNNLLSAIMSYTYLCIAGLPPENKLVGYLVEVQKSADRASKLTHQLLAFSRQQLIEPKVFSLNELILGTDNLLRRLIGENIEIVIIPDPDLWMVREDPGQMEQVLVNLAVNARDAMPDGGRLVIKTYNSTFSDEEARSQAELVPGESVVLEVSDNGTGMSAEVMSHVFEPFFTTKDMSKGTGLGLSTCHGIVVQNGGRITVDSEVGKGTTFRVHLPRVEDAEVDETLLSDESGYLPTGSETILLVEDEPVVREVVAHLLREHSYKVYETSNGEEALSIARERPGEEIHLLLTDVVMPLMGGKELAEQFKEFRPHTRVLYTSGYLDNAFVRRGEIIDEEVQFMQKPFTPSDLMRKVREVLDHPE